jgi:hypothetical protein
VELSPHQYNVQNDDIARLLSSMASSSKVISQHQFTFVTPTVDAVIYDDGGITGADRFQLPFVISACETRNGMRPLLFCN